MVFLKSSNRLIGLVDGPLIPNENITTTDYTALLAQKVCQCFFVSNCGTISLPIFSFPTGSSLDPAVLHSKTSDIASALKEKEVWLSWTSTDGFKGSLEFIKLSPFQHFFDYVHLLKLGRNQLLNRFLWYELDGAIVKFAMKDLLSWWESSPVLRNSIRLDAIHPSDKQNIRPVFDLIQAIPIIQTFGNEKGGEIQCKAKAMCQYLEKFHDLYQLFSNNQTPFHQKINKAEELKDYFTSWKRTRGIKACNFISKDLYDQAIHTLQSTITFLGDEDLRAGLTSTSILGTNIVENFFSLIRAKLRFPCLWEYACLLNRSWLELMKRFNIDRKYSLPGTQLSRPRSLKYNDQTGVSFCDEDLLFLSQLNSIQISPDVERPSDAAILEAIDLCKRYPCSRMKLTTRQKTCSLHEAEYIEEMLMQERPHADHLPRLFCAHPDCARFFAYSGAYQSFKKQTWRM